MSLHRLLLLVATAACALMAGCDLAEDRPAAAARAQRELGELLFFDARLSADGKISCASCHDPARHFADGRAVSSGVHGRHGTRNAPSLLGVADLPAFFWDGREARLEEVVLMPYTNRNEMGLSSRRALLAKLDALQEYAGRFDPSPDGTGSANERAVANALVAYLRSLPRASNGYDMHTASGRGMNDAELRGLALFNGKAACSDCHRITAEPQQTLTDHRFHHAGIGFDKVVGDIAQALQRLPPPGHDQALGDVLLSDRRLSELGRFAATRKAEDMGAFRTPSLRNVALTAPYLHDGSAPDLASAVDRELYYRGLATGAPVLLTVAERRDLLAFLLALNDRPAAAERPVIRAGQAEPSG